MNHIYMSEERKAEKPPRLMVFIFTVFAVFSLLNLVSETGLLPFGSLRELVASVTDTQAVNVGELAEILQGTPPVTKEPLDRCLVLDPNVLKARFTTDSDGNKISTGVTFDENPYPTVADLAIDQRARALGENAGGINNLSVVENGDYTQAIQKASDLDMSYVHATVNSPESVSETVDFIESAHSNDLIPIVSLCATNSIAACDFDLDDEFTAFSSFYSRVSGLISSEGNFVAIMGPYKPDANNLRKFNVSDHTQMVRFINANAGTGRVQSAKTVNGGNMLVSPGVFDLNDVAIEGQYTTGSTVLQNDLFDMLTLSAIPETSSSNAYDLYTDSRFKSFAERNNARVIMLELGEAGSVERLANDIARFCADDFVQGFTLLNPTTPDDQLTDNVLSECALDVRDPFDDYAWVSCNVDSCLYEVGEVDNDLRSDFYDDRSIAQVCGVDDRERNQIEISRKNGAMLKVICEGDRCYTEKFDTLEIAAPIKQFGNNSAIGTRDLPFVSACAEAVAYLSGTQLVLNPEKYGEEFETVNDVIENTFQMQIDPLNQFAGEVRVGDDITYAMPWLGNGINCSSAILAASYPILEWPDTEYNYYKFHPGSFVTETQREFESELPENFFLNGVYTASELESFRSSLIDPSYLDQDGEPYSIDERTIEIDNTEVQGALDIGADSRISQSLRPYDPTKASTEYIAATAGLCDSPELNIPPMVYRDEPNLNVIGPEIQLSTPEVAWEGDVHSACYAYGRREIGATNTDSYAGGIIISEQVTADDQVTCDIVDPNDPGQPTLGSLRIPWYINPETGSPWINPSTGNPYFVPSNPNSISSGANYIDSDPDYDAKYNDKRDAFFIWFDQVFGSAQFIDRPPRTFVEPRDSRYFQPNGQPNVDIATMSNNFYAVDFFGNSYTIGSPQDYINIRDFVNIRGFRIRPGGTVYRNNANGGAPFQESALQMNCYSAYALVNNDADKPFSIPGANVDKDIFQDLYNRYSDESGSLQSQVNRYTTCSDGTKITTERLQQGDCQYTQDVAQCYEYKYDASNQENFYIRTVDYYGNDQDEELGIVQIPGMYDALYFQYMRLQNDLSGRGLKFVARENIGWKVELTTKIRDAGRRLSAEGGTGFELPTYGYTNDSNDPNDDNPYNPDAHTCSFPEGLSDTFTLENGDKVNMNDIPLARGRPGITDEQFFDFLGYVDVLQEIRVAYTRDTLFSSEDLVDNVFNLDVAAENGINAPFTRNPNLLVYEKLLLSGTASLTTSVPFQTCDDLEIQKSLYIKTNEGVLSEQELIQGLKVFDQNCITFSNDIRFQDSLAYFLHCEHGYDIPGVICNPIPICDVSSLDPIVQVDPYDDFMNDEDENNDNSSDNDDADSVCPGEDEGQCSVSGNCPAGQSPTTDSTCEDLGASPIRCCNTVIDGDSLPGDEDLFIFPAVNASVSVVSSKYGEDRGTYTHAGVDFALPEGTPILAIADGRIQNRETQSSYGFFVTVAHDIPAPGGGEYLSLYAHLSAFADGVDVGTEVKQGEVIGYAGSTGRSTGPHLHLEVRTAHNAGYEGNRGTIVCEDQSIQLNCRGQISIDPLELISGRVTEPLFGDGSIFDDSQPNVYSQFGDRCIFPEDYDEYLDFINDVDLGDQVPLNDELASAACQNDDGATFLEGIDVSHWNGTINWDQVANEDGKNFVFIKATESTGFVSETFDEFMRGADSVGMNIGTYHYMRAHRNRGESGALAEARHYAATIQPYLDSGIHNLKPVIDVEDQNLALSTEELTDWVVAFMNEFETITGVEPMIYATPSTIEVELDSRIDVYDVWVANWSVSQPNINRPWAFWQYTSSGDVSGISKAKNDLNRFYGTESCMLQYYGI